MLDASHLHMIFLLYVVFPCSKISSSFSNFLQLRGRGLQLFLYSYQGNSYSEGVRVVFSFVLCIDNDCLVISSSCLFHEFVRVCVDCDKCLYCIEKRSLFHRLTTNSGSTFPSPSRRHCAVTTHYIGCIRFGAAGDMWGSLDHVGLF